MENSCSAGVLGVTTSVCDKASRRRAVPPHSETPWLRQGVPDQLPRVTKASLAGTAFEMMPACSMKADMSFQRCASWTPMVSP